MARLEGLALPCSLVSLNALLAEPDRLNLIAFLGDYNVRFRRVIWRALWPVYCRDTRTLEQALNSIVSHAAALSIRNYKKAPGGCGPQGQSLSRSYNAELEKGITQALSARAAIRSRQPLLGRNLGAAPPALIVKDRNRQVTHLIRFIYLITNS